MARLRASWRRSRDYGVPADTVEPVFTGAVDDGSLFFECGQEVLGGLSRTLQSEPVSLMLTDPDGVVLNRVGGESDLVRALDRVHLAPGFSYAEREAGTNGLGLALADRVPTLVRAEEHYSASLCLYTCAAAPVIDPVSGILHGSVNLTTWSRSSSELLLALAQSAAGTTAALMAARAQGRPVRPQPRGAVVRVLRLEPGSGSLRDLGDAWTDAVRVAEDAVRAGRVVTAVGEAGCGRATLLAQAFRTVLPRDRILAAVAPEPDDVEAWLRLWTPELGKPHTAVVVSDVDRLPAWAADQVAARVRAVAVRPGVPVALTATRLADVHAPLRALVETVVEVAPLRDRPQDVLPLARHAASVGRGRDVALTPSAERALASHDWPGNVTELVQAMRTAVMHAEVVDVPQLPAAVRSGPSRRLSRVESFERDEILRVLGRSDVTVKQAAVELGISRATLYRRMAHYGIRPDRA